MWQCKCLIRSLNCLVKYWLLLNYLINIDSYGLKINGFDCIFIWLKIYNIYNILIKIIIVELIFIIYFRLVINLAENSTLKTGRKITPDRIPSTSQPTDFLV